MKNRNPESDEIGLITLENVNSLRRFIFNPDFNKVLSECANMRAGDLANDEKLYTQMKEILRDKNIALCIYICSIMLMDIVNSFFIDIDKEQENTINQRGSSFDGHN